MSEACGHTSYDVEILQARQSKTLKLVLGINLGMFVVEFAAGIMARSTALLGDSLDMLGDALVYGFSLYVVSRNDAWKAGSAFIKGLVMAFFGVFVLGAAVYHLLYPEIPRFEAIGLIGLLALTANGICLLMLWKHRAEDINMRSVWLCSRNDIIANVSVLVAALGVWATHSQWPDLLVGVGIAALFLRSSLHILSDARKTYDTHSKLAKSDREAPVHVPN